MRLGPTILTTLSLVLAAIGCLIAATVTASVIENRSAEAVQIALVAAGHDWADVNSDGLQVHIGGIAPSEAGRFNAMHVAGTVVDATRIVDGTSVTPTQPLAPPRFSIEILRNDEGVTLIGLVPATLDRAIMVNEITALAQGAEVVDLLEVASHPEPEGWEEAVDFGLNALAKLTRTKISISAGKVTIDAISSSQKEKSELEARLTRRVPSAIDLTYNISAPRPVITPFTLRFLIDETGAGFDACSTDTTRNRSRILDAAREAGMTGEGDCVIGLGVPTPEWSNAVIQGIEAVKTLGGGSITFSDADVTLVAPDTTPQGVFDRIVGELESNLPEVFSLQSILPEPVSVDGTGEGAGPPEFVATRSPEGQVQLRGRLTNEMIRETVDSFAKARFGVDSVYMAARIDEELPSGWTVRVLTGLQALAELDSGSAVIQEDYVEIRGTTGNPEAQAEIARLFAEKLGNAQNFSIEVTYDEKLDPVAALPTPAECVGEVNALLAGSKITFEPGSADISGGGIGVVNEIADILKACRDVEMEIEIAGHTDSQGREEMNLELSQQRSDAVLEALMARRVLVSGITAKGYGESTPIADNGTEDGREANRRIEFILVENTEEADGDVASDAAAPDGADAPTDDASETPSGAADASGADAEDASTGTAEDGTSADPEQDEGTEEGQ